MPGPEGPGSRDPALCGKGQTACERPGVERALADSVSIDRVCRSAPKANPAWFEFAAGVLAGPLFEIGASL